MMRINVIRQRLEEKLSPETLNIIDESHLHQGHPGAKDGRGHFAIEIASDQFQGKTAVQCHRLIYDALDDLMKTDIHALRIKIKNECAS